MSLFYTGKKRLIFLKQQFAIVERNNLDKPKIRLSLASMEDDKMFLSSGKYSF